MAGAEDKLDQILWHLEELSGEMKMVRTEIGGVRDNVTAVRADVEQLKLTVNAIEGNVDTKINNLKDSMYTKIDEDIEQAKLDMKENLYDEVKDILAGLIGDVDISAVCTKQNALEKELNDIKALVDGPFLPDRSVVVYGLKIEESETLDNKVEWLLQTVLGLTSHPEFFEKTDDKTDNKPGVVKIEFNNKWDKIAALKAKRKCLEVDSAKGIIIRSCDSHDARVSKLNARFFISKLSDAKNYIVTSHGLVKRKVANAGGNGSAVAKIEGDAEGKAPIGGVSDNGGADDNIGLWTCTALL